MKTIELCAGDGGGLLGDLILGHTCIAAVEREPHCQTVLRARQKQTFLPEFPIYDDVRTFDGRPWRGTVDVVAGGIPCQGFSGAGKGLGEFDPRNLWPDAFRILKETRAPWFFLENVANLCSFDYWGVILQDLASAGYDARWCVLSAGDVGAPHLRKRVWLLATDTRAFRLADSNQHAGEQRRTGDADESTGGRNADRGVERADTVADPKMCGRDRSSASLTGEHSSGDGSAKQASALPIGGCGINEPLANPNSNGCGALPITGRDNSECHTQSCGSLGHARPQVGEGERSDAQSEQPPTIGAGGQSTEPDVGGMADGVANQLDRPEWWAVERGLPRVAGKQPHRADRLRAIGNGQVSLCRAVAWKLLGGP